MALLTPRSVYRRGEEPSKDEIVQLLEAMQDIAGGGVSRSTLAQLNTVTPAVGTFPRGEVKADPDASNNGWYSWDGSEWVFDRGFPDTFARVTLGGTANAQTGAVSSGVNPADIEVFIGFVATANTGPMTLAVGGENPRDVVNLAGNPLSAGEWTGVVLFVLNEDGNYQLIIDAGAAAAAAQSASEAAGSAADALVDANRTATNALAVVDRAWFKTVSDLLADNNSVIGYAGSGADFIVGPGDIIEAQGFRYEVVASDATDAHVETAGGVKLYVLPDQKGRINVLSLGAVNDAIAVGDYDSPDGAITSGDNTFTSAQASWVAGDIGKAIMVAGAGAAGVNLITTIASVNSSTSIELTDAAATTVASAKYIYGTDNTEVFRTAFAIRQSIFIPFGGFMLTGALTNTTELQETVTWNIEGAGLWGIIAGELRGTWTYYCVEDEDEAFLTYNKVGGENTNSNIGGFWFTGVAGRQGRFLVAERSFARDKLFDLEFSYIKGVAIHKHDSYSKRWSNVKTIAVDYGLEWPVPEAGLGLGEGSTQNHIFDGCRFRATEYGIRCLIPIQTTQFRECIWDTKDSTNSDGINSIFFDKVVTLAFYGGYNESRDCGTFEFNSDTAKGYPGHLIMEGMTHRNRYTGSRNSTGMRLRGRLDTVLRANYWNGWDVPIEFDCTNGSLEYSDSFANCNAPGDDPDYFILDTSTSSFIKNLQNGRTNFGRPPSIGGKEVIDTGDSSGAKRALTTYNGVAEEYGIVDITGANITSTDSMASGWFRTSSLEISFLTDFNSIYSASVEIEWNAWAGLA